MQDQQQEQSTSEIPKDAFTISFVCTEDKGTLQMNVH